MRQDRHDIDPMIFGIRDTVPSDMAVMISIAKIIWFSCEQFVCLAMCSFALIISSRFYASLPHHGKALNSLTCADVPLRNCSLTDSCELHRSGVCQLLVMTPAFVSRS